MKTIAHNLLLFAALALPALCAAQPKPTDDPQRNLQKFDNFYRYLNMTYVDTVHNGQLVENAIREVLLQLDPHSAGSTAIGTLSPRGSTSTRFSSKAVTVPIRPL